jgi:mannosyltransferase
MIPKLRSLALISGGVGLIMALAGSWIPQFWTDERATLRASRLSWGALWDFVQHRDAVHGVYYAFMHPWLGLFGSSPLVARLPSAVAVALAVAGVTAIGCRLTGNAAGISSGLVLALLPVTSHYGMEARSYAFTCALVTWAMYCLLRACEPGASRRWWVGYGVLMLAAAAVFIYALLVGLAHVVTLLLARRPVAAPIIALVWVALVVSPLVRFASHQEGQVAWISRVRTSNIIDSPLSWTVAIPQPFSASSGTRLLLHTAAVALCLLLWVLVVKTVLQAERPDRPDQPSRPLNVVTIAGPWLVLPALILILISLVHPTFAERYVFFSAPAFALLVGHQLARLPRRGLIGVVAVMVLLALPLWIADRTPLSKSGRQVTKAPARQRLSLITADRPIDRGSSEHSAQNVDVEGAMVLKALTAPPR